MAPTWIVALSVVPIITCTALIFTNDHSVIWSYVDQQTGLDRERATGVAWICTAVYSLGFLIALCVCQKRWSAWVAFVLHALFVALTIFPGSIAVTFLMNWGRGPGW